MKKTFLTLLCGLVLCSGLTACVHGPATQIKANITATTADNAKIELPANYSQKNYKRLAVGVYFVSNQNTMPMKGLPVEAAVDTLETEIKKLSRFTMLSRGKGQEAIMKEKQFQDLGTTDKATRLRFGFASNASYVLACSVTATRERFNRNTYDELLYKVYLDYQIVDTETGEIIEADIAEGRALRQCVITPSGKYLGGFDIRNGEADPLKRAGLEALKVLSHRLGSKLPIGGQVVAMRASVVQIDKGRAEGFMSKQMAVLYTNDFGVDVPFALVEVNPGEHTSRGEIIRWSKKPEDQALIREFQNDPTFIARNEVFAVSLGMPLPPEWENNYSD